MRCIYEEVNGREARGHERSPPPVVVFGSQVEVAQQDGSLRTGDDEDERYKQQEAEHVVDLVRPDRVEDEKQLDENAPERQNTAHDNTGDGTRVEHLLRDVARDGIRSH